MIEIEIEIKIKIAIAIEIEIEIWIEIEIEIEIEIDTEIEIEVKLRKAQRRNVISKTLRCARPRRIVQQNVELTVGRNSCIHRCAHTETQIISIIHPIYGWVTKLRHGA